jgi:hypothetical protein
MAYRSIAVAIAIAYGTDDEEPADRIAWTAGSNDRADEGADDYTDEEG